MNTIEDLPRALSQAAWMIAQASRTNATAKEPAAPGDDGFEAPADERVKETSEGALYTNPQANFSVELVPGTTRIVTTVIDPSDGGALFHIPVWWDDVDLSPKELALAVYA